MTGKTAADAKAEVLEHERPERREHMDAPELTDLEVATIRVVQEDLPLVERPFAALGRADRLRRGDRARAAAVVQGAQADAPLRRGDEPPLAPATRPTPWACGRSPTRELDEIGPQMAGFALVSHCYRRPTYDDWPYSIFTMVHGKNARECEETIAAIHDETGVDEYALLWSVKEYKKTRVRYFTDEWDDWRADAPHARPLIAP